MYLDWNATAPMSPTVRTVYLEALEAYWANPHSQHNAGRKALVEVEKAREKIANIVGVFPKNVRFTSGATEANSWLFSHYHHQRAGNAGRKILGSAIEHPSVLEWLDDTIPVNPDGVIQLDVLEKQLHTGKYALLSVMAANNETGVLQPMEEIHRLAQRYSVPFHCDASQVYNKIQCYISADFITISSHKMGGPKGVGALVLQKEITPLLRGGSQERGTRAGTVNAPVIIAMAEAMASATAMDDSKQRRFEQFLSERVSVQFMGAGVARLPNTSLGLFSVPGDMIVMALDMAGIAVSTGAACSSASSKDSAVLEAMGYQGKPVRFSWGHDTDIESAMHNIVRIIAELEQTCEW